MRVIAGEFGGRSLVAPAGEVTRPILDRVKVAVFDWLGSRLAEPGHLPPINVLDLFCGGGSLGIEALSRGAAACTFVDQDADALACLRQNLESLGLGKRARVVARPVETSYISRPAEGGFSLVFLDPPYRLSEDVSPTSVVSRIGARLGTDISIQPEALMIWRHDARFTPPPEFGQGWTLAESRNWGGMSVTIFVYTGEYP